MRYQNLLDVFTFFKLNNPHKAAPNGIPASEQAGKQKYF